MDYPKRCKQTEKSGTNKIYYHTEKDDLGWLEFRDNNESGKINSIECYNNLSKIRDIHLPKIYDVEKDNYPKLLDSFDENGKEAQCGYFIQHLDIAKPFKPKMCVLSSDLVKLNEWGITSSDIDKSINDMKEIEKHLDEIVKEISELTLAFDKKEKKIFLLDFEKPQTENDSGIIKTGVKNIIEELKKKQPLKPQQF